jgi:hypothetical protein
MRFGISSGAEEWSLSRMFIKFMSARSLMILLAFGLMIDF